MKKLIVAAALAGMSLQAATVATVNGKKIDERDLVQVMQQITRGQYAQLPQASKDQVKKVAIEQAIGQILIQQTAHDSKIMQTSQYKYALAETLAKIEPQLAAEVWLKQEFNKVKVTPAEVKKFYNDNKDKFSAPKQVHARHILVKEDNKKLAVSIINQLKGLKGKALQSKFEALAKKHSTGPSAPKGGDLGFFPKGAMVPAFDKAVFSMKVGTVTSIPVKTRFGYHVIYLQEVKGGKSKGFKALKPQVEQALKGQKFQKILKAKVEKLKKKAKISYK